MKLGIVGSGMIVKDFLKMFNELNGIELLGISARNEENLKNLCVQYPIERYYLSYEEMLENKDIDTKAATAKYVANKRPTPKK